MVLNYEWNGILKYRTDAHLSLKEYGFATKFNHRTEKECFYDCLIPDEDETYYLCTLSVEEVRDIVDEHPELPIKENDVDKTEIGELLYLLELYCDISDILDLKDSEIIEYNDIEFDDNIPTDFIDSDVNPKRKRITSLSMTKEKAQMALRTINKYNMYVLDSYYKHARGDSLSKVDISKMNYCKRVLRLCGETVKSFMEKIKKGSGGKIYWLKDGEYVELK